MSCFSCFTEIHLPLRTSFVPSPPCSSRGSKEEDGVEWKERNLSGYKKKRVRKEKTGKKMKLEKKGRKGRQSMQKKRPEPVAKKQRRSKEEKKKHRFELLRKIALRERERKKRMEVKIRKKQVKETRFLPGISWSCFDRWSCCFCHPKKGRGKMKE